MKSLIIQFAVLLLTSLASLTFASKLKDLLLYKYRDHLLPNDFTEPDTMQRPTFERIALTDADNLRRLDNFEQDPQAVFIGTYIDSYAFNHAVRDYANDDTSKEIISYYKEIGLADVFVEALIYYAFFYNVPEVVELFTEFIKIYYEAGRQGQYKGSTWMDAAIKGGSFDILESLINKGIYIVPPSDMVYAICSRFDMGFIVTKFNIEKALDFLYFLIRLRSDVDVNVRFRSYYLTPLLACLKVQSNNSANQERIANFLIGLGANPYIMDENGASAVQLASIRNIKLAGF